MEKPENYIGHHESEATSEQSDNFAMMDPATGEPDWLMIARNAFTNSTDYLDANIRTQIEKNISLFRSKHPSGSKYHQDSYKFRSKVFRPKTRSVIRRHMAAAAVAFFGTSEMVSTKAEDSRDKASVMGANFGKNWLEYRLEHSIKWFKTVLGAYQDAMVQGIIISRQDWVYEEEEENVEEPKLNRYGIVEIDEAGEVINETRKQTQITVDKPDITLIPLENFRFSVAADWRDPVGTSPYLIELIPMFVQDVKERMAKPNAKTGEPKWIKISDGEIVAAGRKTGDMDSTRMTREGNREDSKDPDGSLNLYDIVWVHRNIVRFDGGDHVFYTLGTEALLSEPVPLKQVFLHGRPYTIGVCEIETHKQYPSGVPEMTQDLQMEANDLANQRLDNIKLVLNKRYLGKRNTNTDWRALTSSVPGGVVLMDDLTDVKAEEFTDVTASAYQEQDRVNVDFDELVGNFSSSSVQTNRSLNETVGGMSMALDDSNIVTEYQLRVFTETWVEDTLRMLLEMGKHYETDERVLSIIGEGAAPDAVAELLDTTYGVRVGVGFGATSPHKRIEKMKIGLGTIAEFLPQEMQRINADEVSREIFGALGYRDGSRFFFPADEGKDPQIAQLEEKIGQLESMLQGKQMEMDNKLQIAQIREQGQTQREQLKLQLTKAIANLDGQIKYIAQQVAAEKNDIARGELLLQQETLEFQKRNREIELLQQENDRMSSVLMNDRYGDIPAAEDLNDGKKRETINQGA